MNKPHIILASQSIGRKMLLEKLNVPFSVQVSSVDEDKITGKDPYETLTLRAKAKGEDVSKRLAESVKRKEISSPLPLNASRLLIIAADSMAILGNKTFGKARDKTHAGDIIRSLMGRTHDFVTATTIICSAGNKVVKQWNDISQTSVTCRTMNEKEIEEYTNRYDFSRFAAGYALNETPWDWVTGMNGSYTNVVGLPFEILLPILRELEILK